MYDGIEKTKGEEEVFEKSLRKYKFAVKSCVSSISLLTLIGEIAGDLGEIPGGGPRFLLDFMVYHRVFPPELPLPPR